MKVSPFFTWFCCVGLISLHMVAQNGNTYSALFIDRNTNSHHFAGKVKAVKTKYSHFKPQPNARQVSVDMLHLHVSTYRYMEFYENGLKKCESLEIMPDSVYHVDLKKCYVYRYDNDDIATKSKLSTALKPYPNRYDNYLYVNANTNEIHDGTFDFQGLTEDIWQYRLDVAGRVLEQTHYVNLPPENAGDTIPLGKPAGDSYVNTRISNTYGAEGLVVKQKLTTYYYHPDGEETQISYQYDDHGRITEIQSADSESLVTQENYSYNDKDMIESATRYYRDRSFASTILESFNEHGDVIKREFIRVPAQVAKRSDLTPYYYRYDYDSHGNWIRCYVYLQGNTAGEPTGWLERQIAYYD